MNRVVVATNDLKERPPKDRLPIYLRNRVRDLGKKFVRELEEFFVNYHALSGEKYRILDVKGPSKARRRIHDGIEATGKEQ